MSKTELLLTIIPIVVALTGIVSPVVVAFMNNRHQIKMRRLELNYELSKSQIEVFYSCKKTAYDNLLQEIGQQMENNSIVSWRNFRSAINSAILYADDESKQLIIDFLNFTEKIGYPSDVKETKLYFDKMTTLASCLNDDLRDTYSVINRSGNRQK